MVKKQTKGKTKKKKLNEKRSTINTGKSTKNKAGKEKQNKDLKHNNTTKKEINDEVEGDVKKLMEEEINAQINDYIPIDDNDLFNNKILNDDPNFITDTLIEKNGVIVDNFIPNSLDYQVVLDKNRLFNSKAFTCTLNYSNISRNNNKFYIIQLIQKDKTEDYYIFLRWGRVGRKGQTNLIKMMDLDEGISFFLSKYESKIQYGYEEVALDFTSRNVKQSNDKDNKIESMDNNNNNNNSNDIKYADENKLNDKVIELIRLIYNITTMNDQMKEIGYDSSRLPLGKISKETIIDGYAILQEIEKIINKESQGNISALTSKFYTKIPHNFDFMHLSSFVIDTEEKLNEKIGLLESLRDIKITTMILDEGKSHAEGNQLQQEEANYNQLNCYIKAIDFNSNPMLSKYLNACDSIDNHSTLVLLEAFELHKEEQHRMFNKNIGNVKLLWFGTRITNYVNLLKNGFRIAPPEAPSSNFPFGKGIYFSDISAKAACSCYPSNEIGLLLLCEVALGQCFETTKMDSTLPKDLPEGMNSVKGCGMNVPDSEEIHNGVAVPTGKPIKSTMKVSNDIYELYNFI